MSLSALLNEQDEDIIPINNSSTTNNKNNSNNDHRLKYLNKLNDQFNRYKFRDNLEWLYQDWKFLNLQEFELINEWNYLNLKDLNKNRILLLSDNGDSVEEGVDEYYTNLNSNWERYLVYKDTRYQTILRSISNKSNEKISVVEVNDNNNNNNNMHSEEQNIEIDQGENSTQDEEEDKDKNKDEDEDTNRNEEENEVDEHDGELDENDEEDEEEGEEEDDEDIDDLDEEQFEDIYNEDDKDQDFTIGYQRKTKRNPRLQRQNQIDYNPFDIDIHSDRKFIVKELERLYKKHKGQRTKKRRFTNIFINDYQNNVNNNNNNFTLKIRITLKQNHSKKLRRLINEDKRRQEKLLKEKLLKEKLEKELLLKKLNSNNNNTNDDSSSNSTNPNNSTSNTPTTSPSKKRRKLNPSTNNTSDSNGNDKLPPDNNNSINNDMDNNNNNTQTVNKRKTHDLPTYGIKMSAREARAIQRHYDNTYITIWKDMARKDSNRMLRLYQQIQSVRSTNFKKTSSLCAREAKKWQSRNFKQVKDLQTKARRGIREMSNFWKRNEREEREIKKRAEKIALEQAKREEEERENKRQAKKLNFLLTQTELYSHFIGRKIKTSEIEGNESASATNKIGNTSEEHDEIDLERTSANRTSMHDIDFDNEDDEQLRRKAAENASSVIAQNRAKAKAFDSKTTRDLENGNDGDDYDKNNEEDDDSGELNFQNPTSLGDITLEQPKLLACTLKEYQLKGLNWLANLYDQGINGILADEMGLGKTVQSISVLAHLAEHYNIWGPFLVVTPASTLHNWVNEINKFVPDFKILPYWGNANDRKILRKFWDRKNLRYNKDSPFHVMITSYQMVVSDVTYLQKMRWQYMILDEAQAIKSSQSSRWKNLLSFHCRNRLLLTGTPIQNNMQELWALLHFIMPTLFDSHDEFSEWFSKDIESHAEGNGQLNQQQVRRLHMILKPFMLRRVKKNVQSELGDKIEIDVLCDLTQRQKKLYQVLKSQLSSNYDDIENAAGSDESNSDQSLINAVMQFRKVCNHPDLFERADVESPFSFATFGKTGRITKNSSNLGGANTISNNSLVNITTAECSTNNGTIFNHLLTNLTDVVYSSRNPITYHLPRLIYNELLLPQYENSLSTFNKIVNHMMNIYLPINNRELSAYLYRISGYNGNDVADIHSDFLITRLIKNKKRHVEPITRFERSLIVAGRGNKLTELAKTTTNGVLDSLLNIRRQYFEEKYFESLNRGYHDGAAAPPITIEVLGSSNFSNKIHRELFEPVVSQAFSDIPSITQYNMHVKKGIPIEDFPMTGLYPTPLNKKFSSNIFMPSMDRFITDSAKLKKLDEMLPVLKAEGHRVLIYFQMTKMMDLMEEYLTYKQYNHIRLDGSSKLEDRRDLVHDWQTKPEIFIFLLSTRAGGLGINLTAADTVIFYDSDWNPTIDSQAMDRAHRLGQTRQVTVYRLLVKGTIEERMRDRAKQKEQVQQVVMEGKTQGRHVKTIDASAKIGEKSN